MLAPTYSPPIESPCSRRQASSSAGAARPISSYVGSSPIASVAPAISRIDDTNAVRRPKWSPMCPKSRPPIGRTRKPTAKIANVLSRAAVGSPAGKNCWARTPAR
jgi:hypothetical protein